MTLPGHRAGFFYTLSHQLRCQTAASNSPIPTLASGFFCLQLTILLSQDPILNFLFIYNYSFS